MAVIIQAKNLGLTFNTGEGAIHALEDINIEIQEGEFVALIGPSGCGKTTFLRLIADLESKTQGELLVDNKTTQESRQSRTYGYVFQSAALYPWKTVEKNVQLPLEVFKVPKKERQAITERVLKLVDLTGFEKKYPWQLSGGMQQRVSIARALSFQAKILLMDEPFGALDEITRENLNEQLHNIWKESKKTIVFVTHSVPEAVFLSTKIIIFSKRPGRILHVIDNKIDRTDLSAIRTSKEFIETSHAIRKFLENA